MFWACGGGSPQGCEVNRVASGEPRLSLRDVTVHAFALVILKRIGFYTGLASVKCDSGPF
jgi:hypothetical protein